MPLNCNCAVHIVNLGNFLQITVERQGLQPKRAIVSRFNLYIPFCSPTVATECIPISQMAGATDSDMVVFYALCCHKWESIVSFNYQCTIEFTDTDGSTYSFTPGTKEELCAWLSQLPCAPNCAILPSVSAPTTVLSVSGVTLTVTDTHGTSNSTPCSTWDSQSVTATSVGGDTFDLTGQTDLALFFCGTQLNMPEIDLEVVALGVSVGTAPNYDWSADFACNTDLPSGIEIDLLLTGIPGAFVAVSLSPASPATANLTLVGNKVVTVGVVPAGTTFTVSGTLDNAGNATGTATLTITGDNVTTNNTATASY